MSMSIPIPLDNDGFLRRECPTCGREFKWHDGPANEEAEVAPVVDVYYCPLCGAPAGPDDWWTQSQLDFIHGNAAPLAMRQMGDMLADAFKGVKGVKFESRSDGDIPDAPDALSEPDDMQMIASPCHAYEPIKVPEGEGGPFHCLVCGGVFAI